MPKNISGITDSYSGLISDGRCIITTEYGTIFDPIRDDETVSCA